MAKSNLEKMLAQCAKPVEPDGTNEELISVQKKSVLEVTYELVRQVTSPTDSLREQVPTLPCTPNLRSLISLFQSVSLIVN